jgi:ABC-2 type transport system permease protein
MGLGSAFLRRDYLIWISYRFNLVSHWMHVAVFLGFIYFAGRILGGNPPDFLSRYDTDYVGFLLVGIAFAEVWSRALAIPGKLREAQSLGTLEVMLVSPHGLARIMLASALFVVCLSLVTFVAYVIMAVGVLGYWHNANLLVAALVFVLMMAVMIAIGLLSCAFVLVLKEGDPVIATYGLLNAIFGGIFFPPVVLPIWLQPVSFAMPLTHGLEAMRLALVGRGFDDVWPQLLILSITLILLIPAVIVALKWAVGRAKMEGSLVQY